MKRRFTEEQIIEILREQEAGGAVKEITRRAGSRIRASTAGRPSTAAWRSRTRAGCVRSRRRTESSSGFWPRRIGQRGAEGRARPKVVRPAGKRAVITHLVEAHGLSERRACRLAGLNLSTWRSEPEGRSGRRCASGSRSWRASAGVLAIGACMPCSAARVGGSITRRCTDVCRGGPAGAPTQEEAAGPGRAPAHADATGAEPALVHGLPTRSPGHRLARADAEHRRRLLARMPGDRGRHLAAWCPCRAGPGAPGRDPRAAQGDHPGQRA